MSAGAGYSGTPLAKKLGIASGTRVRIAGAPAGYRDRLAPLPDGVVFASRVDAQVDLVHAFHLRAAQLEGELAHLRGALRDDAVVWISWPKRSAGAATDITEDTIRSLALPLGFVDVKVCAVDATWSALKLVVRRELRTSARPSKKPA